MEPNIRDISIPYLLEKDQQTFKLILEHILTIF